MDIALELQMIKHYVWVPFRQVIVLNIKFWKSGQVKNEIYLSTGQVDFNFFSYPGGSTNIHTTTSQSWTLSCLLTTTTASAIKTFVGYKTHRFYLYDRCELVSLKLCASKDIIFS